MEEATAAMAALRVSNDIGVERLRKEEMDGTDLEEKMAFDMTTKGGRKSNNGDDDDGWITTKEMDQRRKLDIMLEEQSTILKNIRIIEMPTHFRDVSLYDHQKQGISWLVENEKSTAIPSYWQEYAVGNVTKWRCKITKVSTRRRPKPIHGSILADEMGLGKTLQSVGLMLLNPPRGQSYPYDELGDTSAPRCTLIVCPVSVLANWKIQINNFINNGGDGKEVVKVELFYGGRREDSLLLAKDNKVDVLLTSYHQLVSEMKMYQDHKRKELENQQRIEEGKRPRHKLQSRTYVFEVGFHRIILDECHEIRNSNTQFFKSACLLKSKLKLCITGTPFVNRPQDIGSLLTFLKVKPLSNEEVFEKNVTEPIKNRKEVGLARLRTTMSHVCIRRTKELVGVVLDVPEKDVQIRTVALADGPHRDVLEVFSTTTRACIVGLFRMGGNMAGKKLGAIFGLLLRVRQSCDHIELVPPYRRAVVQSVANDMKEKGMIDLGCEEGIPLLEKLIGELEQKPKALFGSDSDTECDCASEDDDSEATECEDDSDEDDYADSRCLICSDIISESKIISLGCDHIFCYECLDPSGGMFCPSCREPYTLNDVDVGVTALTPKKTPAKKRAPRRFVPVEEEVTIDVDTENVGRSPKVQALLDTIEEMDEDEKAVIFSQWTSFLDIIEEELDSLGHFFTRIDGTMDAKDRISAMEKFATKKCDSKKTPRFILCSLRACGTGINLTRGNVVFMMDPWYNSAVEEQAMDRVHRIGQTRPVRIYRFVMRDSIEERMVELQRAKAALGKGSLQKITKQERSKAQLTFLRDLFNIGDQEVQWDTDLIEDVDDDFEYDDDDDDDDLWI